jgi:hypothetical protein
LEEEDMNVQQMGSFGRGLFWLLLILGSAMNLGDMGTLPLLLILVLVTAPVLFPNFRRRIRLRRVFLFSLSGMVIFLGTFYWIVSFRDPDNSGMFSDECAVWPFGDFVPDGSLPQIYLVPLWIFKSALLGFILESLVVLGQHVRANLAIPTLHQQEPSEANQPPFGAAGAACLACMVAIYLVNMLLFTLYPSCVNEWLVTLYIIGPFTGAFMVLYFNGWHRQRKTRLFSVIWRSCTVFGITSLFVVLIILAMLTFLLFGYFGYYSRSQYGAT